MTSVIRVSKETGIVVAVGVPVVVDILVTVSMLVEVGTCTLNGAFTCMYSCQWEILSSGCARVSGCLRIDGCTHLGMVVR